LLKTSGMQSKKPKGRDASRIRVADYRIICDIFDDN